MDRVIKVNIGGLPFSMGKDAYDELNRYLELLSNYYSNNGVKDEIVEEIEQRIAELLSERGYSDRVVDITIVKEIISILGDPHDFDSSKEEGTQAQSRAKKLYRDLKNKIFGGVLAGLANYINVNVTLIRIAVVITLFLSLLWFDRSPLLLFIVGGYLLLWIFMPAAKTVEQRYSMKGKSISLENIEENIKEGVNEIVHSGFFNKLFRVLKVIMGFALLILGVIGLVVCGSTLLGISILGYPLSNIMTIVGLSLTGGLMLRILLFLVMLLPCVGMIYGGIILLFNFNTPKWRPGLIIFILWLTSTLLLSIFGFISAINYRNNDYINNSVNVTFPTDTIYIEYDDIEECSDMKVYIDATMGECKLFYLSNDAQYNIISYPRLNIIRSSREQKIISSGTCFQNSLSFEDWKTVQRGEWYDFDGNKITLLPQKIDKEHPISVINRKVTIVVPKDVVVVMEKPIYHDFSKNTKYSNIKYLD